MSRLRDRLETLVVDCYKALAMSVAANGIGAYVWWSKVLVNFSCSQGYLGECSLITIISIRLLKSSPSCLPFFLRGHCIYCRSVKVEVPRHRPDRHSCSYGPRRGQSEKSGCSLCSSITRRGRCGSLVQSVPP